MRRIMKNKKIKKWGIIALITVVVSIVIHEYGIIERGYNAIGGEILLFIIPFFIWMISKDNKNNKYKKRG